MKRDKRFFQAIVEGKSEEEKIEILSQELARIILEEGDRSEALEPEKMGEDNLNDELDDLYEVLNFT